MADESEIITPSDERVPVVSEAQRNDLSDLVAMKRVVDTLKGPGQKTFTDF